MIQRQIEPLIALLLGSGKAIIIMGARQVGKSTLLHQLFDSQENVLWMNGDDADVRTILSDITSTRLKALLANQKILIINEAQRINDIGLKLNVNFILGNYIAVGYIYNCAYISLCSGNDGTEIILNLGNGIQLAVIYHNNR